MAGEENKEPKAPAKKPAAKPKADASVTAGGPTKADTPQKAEAAKPTATTAPASAQPVAKSGKTVTVTQLGSPIGRPAYQHETLKGLGLNKRHRSRTLEDTPEVRGMIARVKHLISVGDGK